MKAKKFFQKVLQSLGTILGTLFLIVGFIGVFLPVLPTVPFLLLSAFFYSRSSPRLHAWLLRKKGVGPLIRDWEKHGVIRTKSKIFATVMMVVLMSYPVAIAGERIGIPVWARIAMVVVGVSVLGYIWTRPGKPKR